ncbi:hypothetical protein LI82_02645 [Methanococcoides methylutens]|uniref:Uncharacterized protein n=1 Tax=Methanococcoides methylutens TaxID=2226 RepID=A0A099T213_METMT|nr:hypothetical protein [Methanococcoides methylutens]KGK98959.1 hypothetical protein LI82_02645 [Methanococcoides methylutens]
MTYLKLQNATCGCYSRNRMTTSIQTTLSSFEQTKNEQFGIDHQNLEALESSIKNAENSTDETDDIIPYTDIQSISKFCLFEGTGQS